MATALPPKWRLVIQRKDDGECVPYLLERIRVRMFLDGSVVPVWLAPPRAAACAYKFPQLTVRPNPGHYFRLMTGTEPQEQRLSESLNFRGMWPQEIYVYMREFQAAVHDHVRETFAAQMEHIERRRRRDAADMEAARKRREKRQRDREARDQQIIALHQTGKTPFGIAVELRVRLSAVYDALKRSPVVQ